MKKYIAPQTEKFSLQETYSLCAGTIVLGTRRAQWGSEDEYGTKDWINQGYGQQDVNTSVIIDDDNGTLNSMSKRSLWDDDDFDD